MKKAKRLSKWKKWFNMKSFWRGVIVLLLWNTSSLYWWLWHEGAGYTFDREMFLYASILAFVVGYIFE